MKRVSELMLKDLRQACNCWQDIQWMREKQEIHQLWNTMDILIRAIETLVREEEPHDNQT